MRGLYIHIPFCIKKCKYCDFNSFPFSCEDKRLYLDALIKNMSQYNGEEIDTVFIGGGTPTSLSGSELSLLLDAVNKTFKLSDNCEFSVEMNPKTVDREKLMVLKEKGVNRLSLGVQSFNDDELKKLGRIHTSGEALETVSLIKECGFDNFSIDLMSAIPSQTFESFSNSLNTAIGLSPMHISCYSLILEEGTPLYEEYIRGEINLPDEDEERKIYDYAVECLENAGYNRYEISNFAKEGYKSRHNIKYWQCDEYIGVGLSAHSYLDGKRFSMTDDFDEYISGNFERCDEVLLSKEDMMSEFMFMGFRMDKGVSKAEFFRRFGEKIDDVFSSPLLKFKNLGMIIEKDGNYCIKSDAVGISNSIMCEFIL